MITPSDFHEGLIIQDENGNMLKIVHYQHHRKSAARAVVRVKLKNLNTGAVVEASYRPEDKFNPVDVDKRKQTFLYFEGDNACFMDNENYEQTLIPKDKIADSVKFLVENMEVEGLYLNGTFFDVLMPASVNLKVTFTVPGVKGDSVSNMTKPATLENGIEVKVPLFINQDDVVKVDTRTGEYLERV